MNQEKGLLNDAGRLEILPLAKSKNFYAQERNNSLDEKEKRCNEIQDAHDETSRNAKDMCEIANQQAQEIRKAKYQQAEDDYKRKLQQAEEIYQKTKLQVEMEYEAAFRDCKQSLEQEFPGTQDGSEQGPKKPKVHQSPTSHTIPEKVTIQGSEFKLFIGCGITRENEIYFSTRRAETYRTLTTRYKKQIFLHHCTTTEYKAISGDETSFSENSLLHEDLTLDKLNVFGMDFYKREQGPFKGYYTVRDEVQDGFLLETVLEYHEVHNAQQSEADAFVEFCNEVYLEGEFYADEEPPFANAEPDDSNQYYENHHVDEERL